MNCLAIIFVLSLFITIESASKKSKHKHKGILTPYNGRHIDYNISLHDNERLNKVLTHSLTHYYLPIYTLTHILTHPLTHSFDKGEAVTINTRDGKSGRGVVIQDVLAPPNIVMDKIKDIKNYPKVVPNVKKVDVYSEITHKNGIFHSLTDSFTY